MTHREMAEIYFNKGYNCAQSVFLAFSDIHHMDEETAAAVACGLGGGIGRLRDNCGTFSAGVMLCAWAVPDGHKPQSRGAVYTKVQELHQAFIQEFTTVNCADLLGKPRKAEPPIPEKRTEKYYATRPCVGLILKSCDIIDRVLFSSQE